MNLFLENVNNNCQFDLVDLLKIIEIEFANDIIEIDFFDYEYNGVKGDWKEINSKIFDVKTNEHIESVKLDFFDFKKFAEFIEMTEDGSFDIILKNSKSIFKVSVYDSYFWNISNENKKHLMQLLDKLKNDNMKITLEESNNG